MIEPILIIIAILIIILFPIIEIFKNEGNVSKEIDELIEKSQETDE